MADGCLVLPGKTTWLLSVDKSGTWNKIVLKKRGVIVCNAGIRSNRIFFFFNIMLKGRKHFDCNDTKMQCVSVCVCVRERDSKWCVNQWNENTTSSCAKFHLFLFFLHLSGQNVQIRQSNPYWTKQTHPRQLIGISFSSRTNMLTFYS